MTSDNKPEIPMFFPQGGYGGATLRDYFAGMVLQGIIARTGFDISNDPRDAYTIADAMLKEREK